MIIQNTRALRGPNFWSATDHQLIVLSLKLDPDREKPYPPDDTVSNEGLLQLSDLLGMDAHALQQRIHSSEDQLQLIAQIALALQAKAGMECAFFTTKTDKEHNEHTVVFGYRDEEAGKFAARAAVALLQGIMSATPSDIDETIKELRYIWDSNRIGPSTGSVVAEAVRRDIPCTKLGNSFYQFGYGSRQRRIEATIASTTSSIAVEKASDKHRTKMLLEAALIPVPKGIVLQQVENLEVAVKEVGFPIVIKPLDGNQGKGATININGMKEALEAFERAKVYSRKVIIERFVEGADFRALVINYKFVAAAKRTPAAVTGDGVLTVQQLVEQTNKDPRRGNGHCNVLTAIKLDESSLE
ncbi:MAG TPA: cyanophycin synthetase, partial [Flavisolibacter sp.]